MMYTGKWKESSRKLARKIKAKHMACAKLPSWLYVHHIDSNPFNNSLGNLALVDHKRHSEIHLKGTGKFGVVCRGNEKEYYKLYDAIRWQNPERKAAVKRYYKAFKQRQKEKLLAQLKGETNEQIYS